MQRSALIAALCCAMLAFTACGASIRFTAFSDVTAPTRKIERTVLKEIIESRSMDDSHIILNLGDLSHSIEGLKDATRILSGANATVLNVLGNRDAAHLSAEERAELHEVLGIPEQLYYKRRVGAFRFLVLNGLDVSFILNNTSETRAEFHRLLDERVPALKTSDIPEPTNSGAVGSEQLAWLEKQLKKAHEKGEKCIILMHFPTYPSIPAAKTLSHNLWNDREVNQLFQEHHQSIALILSAHSDIPGQYRTNMHHCFHQMALCGARDDKSGVASFAEIEVNDNGVVVRGNGCVKSWTLSGDCSKEIAENKRRRLRSRAVEQAVPETPANATETNATVADSSSNATAANGTESSASNVTADAESAKQNSTVEGKNSTDSTEASEATPAPKKKSKKTPTPDAEGSKDEKTQAPEGEAVTTAAPSADGETPAPEGDATPAPKKKMSKKTPAPDAEGSDEKKTPAPEGEAATTAAPAADGETPAPTKASGDSAEGDATPAPKKKKKSKKTPAPDAEGSKDEKTPAPEGETATTAAPPADGETPAPEGDVTPAPKKKKKPKKTPAPDAEGSDEKKTPAPEGDSATTAAPVAEGETPAPTKEGDSAEGDATPAPKKKKKSKKTPAPEVEGANDEKTPAPEVEAATTAAPPADGETPAPDGDATPAPKKKKKPKKTPAPDAEGSDEKKTPAPEGDAAKTSAPAADGETPAPTKASGDSAEGDATPAPKKKKSKKTPAPDAEGSKEDATRAPGKAKEEGDEEGKKDKPAAKASDDKPTKAKKPAAAGDDGENPLQAFEDQKRLPTGEEEQTNPVIFWFQMSFVAIFGIVGAVLLVKTADAIGLTRTTFTQRCEGASGAVPRAWVLVVHVTATVFALLSWIGLTIWGLLSMLRKKPDGPADEASQTSPGVAINMDAKPKGGMSLNEPKPAYSVGRSNAGLPSSAPVAAPVAAPAAAPAADNWDAEWSDDELDESAPIAPAAPSPPVQSSPTQSQPPTMPKATAVGRPKKMTKKLKD